MSQQPNVTVVQVVNKSNGFGLAGLILSILGWFTCGVLSIPGAIFSLIGLLFAPRGSAIAGLIVGFPGVAFFFLAGMTMLAGALGLSGAAVEQAREAARRAEKHNESPAVSVDAISEETELPYEPAANLTDTADPSEPIDDATFDSDFAVTPETSQPSPAEEADKPDPKSVVRWFESANGKFRVEAKTLSVTETQVTLERTDNGRVIEVDIEKLSDTDKVWIKDNFPGELQ